MTYIDSRTIRGTIGSIVMLVALVQALPAQDPGLSTSPDTAHPVTTPKAPLDSITASLAPLIGTPLRAHGDGWEDRGPLLILLPPDTLVLQTSSFQTEVLRQVNVPLTCVTKLERLDGHYSRRTSVLKGSLTGLVVGLGLGVMGHAFASSGKGHRDFGSAVGLHNDNEAIVVFGLAGAAIGGVMGATKGVERWRKVPLPRPAVSGSCDTFRP